MAGNGLPLDVAQLVADHHAVVYRYAYRLAGSTADAEDLAQQAFLAAQQNGDQLRDADRVRSWLLAVTRNAWLKSLRRAHPEQLSERDLADLADDDPSTPSGEIDRESLQLALAELPDEFRVVVLMFYFEDHSYRDIASQLGIPIGTVMSRLSRAKGHLRRRLTSPGKPAELQPTGLQEHDLQPKTQAENLNGPHRQRPYQSTTRSVWP
jgi:RNA polymerase sigma-70 factor (ECF subfamily)